MSREKQTQQFIFPMKGMNVVCQKNQQPEGTCIDALNVRPYDQIESRARGGSRPGLAKWCTSRQSTNRVQDLNYVTTISNSLSVTSMSRRTIIPVMVTNGVIGKFNSTAVTNASVSGTQALGNATQSPFAHSAELFQRLYYCDGFGYKVYVGSNNAAIDWTPTAGSLPGDIANSVTCRLIEAWRGRIVLSGLSTDPHNWFMSKLGDPLDWDYNPSTETELDAVQGGAGFVGKVPDIINAIIPYNDDVLLFGCDHSIWMMSGDPQAGGRLDLVTNTVGMAFGRPYTQMSDGTLVFMSNRGSIYRMAPGGGKPVSMTEDNIDPLLTNTNLNTNIVRLSYDEDSRGVHTYITPLAGNTNTTHWFWSQKTDAWFKVTFADNLYNPVALMAFDGDSSSDRVLLLGGDDGYVRAYGSSAYRDDGQYYTSYAIMGPIVADAGRYPTILTDLQFIMDNSSSNTKYELGVGDTSELAISDFSAAFTGEVDFASVAIAIPAGRSVNQQPRTRGYFQYFKIGSTAPSAAWAIEYIQASYSIVRSSRGRVTAVESLSYTAPDDPPSLPNTSLLYGAWWARQANITNSTGNASVSAWAPFQAGDGRSPPTFANGSAYPQWDSTGNTSWNTKPTITFNTSTTAFSGSVTVADVDFATGFVTMAIYFDTIGANSGGSGPIAWQFLEAGNTMLGRFVNTSSNAVPYITWTGTSPGNTAANSSLVANTLYIVTFAGGFWRVWSSTGAARTFMMNSNVSQWVGSLGAGATTLTIGSGGSAGTPWVYKIGAVAIYANTQDNTIIRNVENAMATYYGITIP